MSKLKKLLIASLSVALAGAVAIPVTGAIVKASNTEIWSDVAIEAEYLVNDTLNIPDRTLSIGGETYETTIKMTYPNGVTKTVKSGEFSLDVAGGYTLTYEVRVNGKRYSESEEIFVANKLWSVKDAKSSTTYGKVGDTNALLVSLAPNDTLTFNKIVDLSNYTSADALIKGFINPTTVGSYDFEKLIIKVTDAYDPTQVLTVRGNKSTGSVNAACGSYWTAAGPNQTLGGWDSNAQSFRIETEIEAGYCGMYRSVSFCSIKGVYNNNTKVFDQSNTTADKEPFGVHFDTVEKTVDIWCREGLANIADLDKAAWYDSEPLWKGFTSNQVIISVTADGYAGETANFAITQVYGYDSLNVENKFVETDAPEITVDVDDKYVEYDAVLNRYAFAPLAVKGWNYPVPTATAYDGYSGSVSVDTKVYFDYTNTKQMVAIDKTTNTFNVKGKGTYAIVYTAKDFMGNTAERIYWVTAVDALDNPLAMTVNKADAARSGVCGERIELATYSTTGGSADTNVTITATCGDVSMDVSDGILLAEKAGTWTVEYSAKDYAGCTVTDSYEITIALGDKPIFVQKPVFPKYMISGMEYEVPTIYAYDYTTGTRVEKLADMVVLDANGEKTYKAGETYIPVAKADGTVQVNFVCEGASLPLTLAAVSPMDGSSIYIENMFIGTGFEMLRDKNGLTLTARQAGNFGWEFANTIAAEEAALYVKGVEGYSGFEAMKVTFTDSDDESIAVTMYIEHNANGAGQVVFGDTNREIVKGLNLGPDEKGGDRNEIAFSYKLGKFYIDNLGVNVATDDSGNAFNGFPSGKIYMSAEAIGVTAGQKYIIKQIDNHLIGTRARDVAAPKVAINGTYGGMRKINTDYVIGTAIAADVIDPNVLCFVTVTDPNGNVVTDKNNVKLENVPATQEYTIRLTTYGQYQVTYSSTDWAGQLGESNYAINVFDVKAPKVEIVGTYAATAKVGETVTLPEIKISDDWSEFYEMTVFRSVRNPYDVLTVFGYDYTLVKQGEETESTADDKEYWQHTTYTFTFKFAGEYTFNIVVADASGNQTLLQYVVTVR